MADFILDLSNLNVTGTNEDDTFFANPDGNYRIDGSAGFDTIDYSQLKVGITLNGPGTIDKGNLGIDTSRNNERFIGALGQINTLDGTTNGGIPDPNSQINPVINIDLSQNKLSFDNVPGGSRTFEVVNFNRVIGSNNNDTIVGNDLGNQLTGGSGNDQITGGHGNDILTGCNSAARGVGEVDILTGGGGSDTFIIGDQNGAFYVGNGDNDYVSIKDFDFTQDRIDLGASQEVLSVQFDVQLSNSKISTVNLFSNQSGNKDLIAKLELANPMNLGGLYNRPEPRGRCDRLQEQSFGIGNKSWLNDAFATGVLNVEPSFALNKGRFLFS